MPLHDPVYEGVKGWKARNLLSSGQASLELESRLEIETSEKARLEADTCPKIEAASKLKRRTPGDMGRRGQQMSFSRPWKMISCFRSIVRDPS